MSGREIEKRYVPVAELRIESSEGEAGKIIGYAAVFDSLSEDLWGFKETIQPGAFSRAIKEGHDVRALVNHDPSLILGRTKSGTLLLSEDKKGLLAMITPPDTSIARDTIESVRRGDIDGMSFAFVTEQEEWDTQEGGVPLRKLVDVNLVDVSLATYPAYTDTSVAVRSLESWQAEHRPYPNEHACRLNEPDKYAKLRRVNGDQEHDGKKIDVIYGIKEDGKSEVQALRYPKSSWTANDARSHCESHEGSFEAATEDDSKHLDNLHMRLRLAEDE